MKEKEKKTAQEVPVQEQLVENISKKIAEDLSKELNLIR